MHLGSVDKLYSQIVITGFFLDWRKSMAQCNEQYRWQFLEPVLKRSAVRGTASPFGDGHYFLDCPQLTVYVCGRQFGKCLSAVQALDTGRGFNEIDLSLNQSEGHPALPCK